MLIGNQFYNEKDLDNIDNDFEEINKEISKALIDMKKEDNNNENKLDTLNFSGIEDMNNSYSDSSNNSFINQTNTYSNLKERNNCSFTNYHTNHNLLNNSINYNSNNLLNKSLNYGMNILNNSFSGGYYSNINFYNCFAKGNSFDNANEQHNNNYYLDSPKNIIHLDNVLKLKDKRTTIIIRHIPNRYDLEFLMNEININFFGKYDCLYLPMDFVNNSNLGFGFINFIDPIHILLFYTEFIGKKWNYFNSGKRCQLAYAKIQGKNELLKYIYKKNGLNNSDKNRINDLLYKSFYISNDNNNNNKNKYYPLIEIPMKYFNVFKNYYPYSLCHIKNESIFIVDKYYNF